MRGLRARTAAALVVGAMALAGCGSSGSDGATTTTKASATSATTTTATGSATTTTGGFAPGKGPSRAAYVAAMTTSLSEGDEATGDLVLAKGDAACVAPKFIDAIGVDTLHEHNVTAAEMAKPGWDTTGYGLSSDQGGAMVDAFGDCGVDIYTMFAKAMTSGLTATQQSCAEAKLDKDLARKLLVVTFSGGDGTTEFTAVLDQLTKDCKLPSN